MIVSNANLINKRDHFGVVRKGLASLTNSVTIKVSFLQSELLYSQRFNQSCGDNNNNDLLLLLLSKKNPNLIGDADLNKCQVSIGQPGDYSFIHKYDN